MITILWNQQRLHFTWDFPFWFPTKSPLSYPSTPACRMVLIYNLASCLPRIMPLKAPRRQTNDLGTLEKAGRRTHRSKPKGAYVGDGKSTKNKSERPGASHGFWCQKMFFVGGAAFSCKAFSEDITFSVDITVSCSIVMNQRLREALPLFPTGNAPHRN